MTGLFLCRHTFLPLKTWLNIMNLSSEEEQNTQLHRLKTTEVMMGMNVVYPCLNPTL